MMQIGIFAKTFPGSDPATVLASVRAAGFAVAQFNLACAGLPSMPDRVPGQIITTMAAAAASAGVSLVALSGTYNMAHPDRAVRDAGLHRLAAVMETAAALAIPLVTLCTGTRNPDDQWASHPGNGDPSAWADMAGEMAKALELAERHGVDLGIEPEQTNIVASAQAAMRLIAEMGSNRLRIVLDPANLFELASLKEARAIVAAAVETTAGHVAMAHAKDRLADGRFTSPGQGIVDFADFIARLQATGFDGPVVAHGFPVEDAPQTARFLKALL